MLLEAEIWTVARTEQGNAVLIRPVGSEVAVPIFIGQLEAQSILIGLGNVPMPRPLTHDLMLAILEQLHVTVKRIEITALKNDTFYARLVLEQNGQELSVDARPSDSISLAVRVKSPVYIADNVVESAGISVNLITEEDANIPTTRQAQNVSELDKIKKALEKAVEEENYEEAARLRDKLRDLEP